MIVVSDTSAISNLHQIGMRDLLEQVFGQILIPPAVQRELFELPDQEQAIDELSWIQVESPTNQQLVYQLTQTLDLGESEAIALALEKRASYLIIDEFAGRQVANGYDLTVIGLLGVLVQARQKGFIQEVKPHIQALRQHGFRLSQALVDKVLKRLGE